MSIAVSGIVKRHLGMSGVSRRLPLCTVRRSLIGPVGEGTVEFAGLTREMKRMNFQGTLSLAVPKDKVLESKARLHKILESVA